MTKIIQVILIIFVSQTNSVASEAKSVCRQLPPNVEKIKAYAEKGDGYCQAVLGSMYWRGVWVENNYNQAYLWSEKAWKKGIAIAYYNEASIYSSGYGVEASRPLADLAYKKAELTLLKQDLEADPHGNFSLGFITYFGKGSNKANTKEGCSYMLKAAELNHGLSQQYLGDCYRLGHFDEQKNLKQAIFWYEKALSNNQVSAAGQLGHLYLSFEDKKDRAIQYFEIQADRGSKNHKYRYAAALETGKYATPDFVKALQYYLQAIDLGHTRAAYRAATLLYHGDVETENAEKEALRLFQLAAKGGDSDAQNMILALKVLAN